MTAPHNLEDVPCKKVTLKHADAPQHHSRLSKTTQHHITENGFTAYCMLHKEYTLALISVDTYCLRVCRFSRIKRRRLEVRLEVYSSKHMQRWYRDRKVDTPYPYVLSLLYHSLSHPSHSVISFVSISFSLSIFLSIYLYSYFSIHISIYLSIHLFLYLSLFISISLYFFIFSLFIFLSISIFIFISPSISILYSLSLYISIYPIIVRFLSYYI